MVFASANPVSGGLSRRRFLQTSSGTVAVSLLGLPAVANSSQQAQIGTSPAGTPGVAAQRIDGVAKVTGQKVYARDFDARDMPEPWPKTQTYAMFLRALTTKERFIGLRTSALPKVAQSARIVLGNQLTKAQRSPQVSFRRDLVMDQQIKETRFVNQQIKEALFDPSPEGFDRPSAVVYDLIVQPGNVPDYLGQAVALLIFDDFKGYRAALQAMQFQDDQFQIYAPPDGPLPPKDQPFDPKTTYVKYDVDGEAFDYATANPYAYPHEADTYRGKIEARLASIPGLIRQDIQSDMRAMDPMFMEPEAGLAWLDPEKKILRLVLGTQSPDGDVRDIVSMYKEGDAPTPLDEVTLTSCYPGGGFGGRDKSPFSLMLALAAAFTDGRPVKLIYDRFEQFRVGLKRHAATLSGQLAIAPDKTIQNIEMTLQFDGGGRKNLSPYVASLAALCAGGSYKTPMANIYADAIHSENISGGSQRGFGGPQAFFAIETALDDVAAAKGWDPVDLRRINAISQNDTTVVGGPVEQELRLTEMLDMAEAHPLWANRAALKQDYDTREVNYGTGIAMSLQAYGTSGDGTVAAVLITPEGKLTVQSDAVDMGNGSATTLGVVIGDILGANADHVDMGCYTLFGQTGLTTKDTTGTRWANPDWTAKGVGSSSACLTGLHQVHVVQQTAHALFEATLLPAARQIWGQPDLVRSDVTWRNGALSLVDGATDPISLPSLATAAAEMGLPRGALGHAYFQNTWAEADFDLREGALTHLALDGVSLYEGEQSLPRRVVRQNGFGPDSASKRYSRYVWAPCVNIVSLTVHRTTGRVQIENVVSILNAGRIHVHDLVSGQSQGGVAMAISYTLHEDLPPGMGGPANGTWNLDQYHVARMQDVPLGVEYRPGARAQELHILDETPADKGQGRGIAEAVMCSIPPAISNALRDAVGKRYTSLPITPEKILEGLRA
ncbi:xanthine dehydrogenase family protein molybdopterin-binding subunit [Litoreibacter roseus]|uniref:xanthine dehydrogenase family protein molybdopterin-binding subunit n=1 Tax=Litoreibacter roseus TaxID=2601869 RepID=UPI001357C68D|nr:molybdopterin cofactor-binding domain-containing protein [Litoreibacter roseus]